VQEVVPITSAEIRAKIHTTYRIQYLRDVVLPRQLDDATYATLTSLGLFSSVEVIGALQVRGGYGDEGLGPAKQT
jgi:protein phosphatase-4 regulatory subunit 3